jgi:acetoin:2,6-dichlorophenolindophenol oxidoreductase subunit alpha
MPASALSVPKSKAAQVQAAESTSPSRYNLELLIKMFDQMLQIRLFEEKLVEMFARGSMPGLAHLSIGEEAVPVGTCNALRTDDYITSTHRGHGHCIAKGASVDKMMAELFGKATGYCGGKGGSMHIADFEKGILGANGIVGGGIPIAAGAGLGIKVQGLDRVVCCFFGDGASNQGGFHESANLASVWKLPVVYICENNLYGISVSQRRHQAIQDIANRAIAYNMPGKVVDGNDALAVLKAVTEAVALARSGGGPSLIECKTYRWRGHHEGDPNRGTKYRSAEEIAQWTAKCPIERMKGILLAQGADAKQLDQIRERIVRETEAAVKFAQESPLPPLSAALEHVYA